MKIKGTLDADKLRGFSKEAAREAWRKQCDQNEKAMKMTEKEKQQALLTAQREARARRIVDCIEQIPLMLEKAARGDEREEKTCVVFTSPRNNDDIAPEIFAYCKELRGLRADYKIERMRPEGFVSEFTDDDTIYQVVVAW